MNLKIAFSFFFILAVIPSLLAQPGGNWTDKITWSFSVEKIDDANAYIVASAKLKEHWHVYSVNHDPSKAEFTGVPTTFTFVPSKSYNLIGKVIDGAKPKTVNDDLGTHLYFENKAIFKQKIEVLDEKKFNISFSYAFQVCDENGCLFPPDQEGKIEIQGFKPKTATEKASNENSLVKSGEFAKDESGTDYVLHNGEWIKVPKGNSPEFYKKYLILNESNED